MKLCALDGSKIKQFVIFNRKGDVYALVKITLIVRDRARVTCYRCISYESQLTIVGVYLKFSGSVADQRGSPVVTDRA